MIRSSAPFRENSSLGMYSSGNSAIRAARISFTTRYTLDRVRLSSRANFSTDSPAVNR